MKTTGSFSDFSARLRRVIHRLEAEDSTARACEMEFNGLALDLFALQFEHDAPYQRFCAARGITPKTVKDWPQIPTVPTAAFKDLELSCLPAEERTAVFLSSGTTQQRPSRHFHNAESLAVYEASLWPWFERQIMAEPRSAVREWQLVILTPPRPKAPNSSLVYMFETIRRKLGAAESAFVGLVAEDDSWALDLAVADRALQRAEELKRPVIILGTALLFLQLTDDLTRQDRRYRLPPGSRALETGGYKGRLRTLSKPELQGRITWGLGIPEFHIIGEYGMSELSSQAYDRRGSDEGRPFHFPPWARVQIVSPETGGEVGEGETGLIRVFDLANVYSVMAVQTEDLGIRRGDGFELLGRAALAEPRGCSLMAG